MTIPNFFLGFSGLEPAADVGDRVSGLLIAYLGFYYVSCARQELTHFFKLTVYVCFSVIIFFSIFVLLDFAK